MNKIKIQQKLKLLHALKMIYSTFSTLTFFFFYFEMGSGKLKSGWLERSLASILPGQLPWVTVFILYSCHWMHVLLRNSNLELWFQSRGKSVQCIVDHGCCLRDNKSKKTCQSLPPLSFRGMKNYKAAKLNGFF